MVINLEFKGLNRDMFIVADNIDYFGCDYMTCFFMCVEGFTFGNVVGKPRWSNMEGLCVHCAPCHLPNVDGQIDPSLDVVHVGL
jgi:hypothetical protein